VPGTELHPGEVMGGPAVGVRRQTARGEPGDRRGRDNGYTVQERTDTVLRAVRRTGRRCGPSPVARPSRSGTPTSTPTRCRAGFAAELTKTRRKKLSRTLALAGSDQPER